MATKSAAALSDSGRAVTNTNPNDMGFYQMASVLAEIVGQATGQKVLAPINTSQFVSVAQTALKCGFDPVLNALSQVLSRTLFSVRPYTRKFKNLQVDNITYGNHVRKINFLPTGYEANKELDLEDGASIDQFVVKKPRTLQTNFYGQTKYSKFITRFYKQLDMAFRSPEEFQRFVSGYLTEASNEIEQAHEETARATMTNFIGGKILSDPTNKINVLTQYNNVTGLSLTPTSVREPDNYKNFIYWLYGFLRTLSDQLECRCVNYHVNVTGKEILRHTPRNKQSVYLYAPELNQIESRVLAATYNEYILSLQSHERVVYWQNIQKPDTINVQPSYMNENGEFVQAESSVSQPNVLGLICDWEALGYTIINNWSANTPFNAAAGYFNTFWHFTDRYWNDFTENALVLIME